ncbi:MAG: HEAT repeat domain-containing protein [Planctomycetota bacterium]
MSLPTTRIPQPSRQLAKWMVHDDAPVREAAMKGLVAHGAIAEAEVLKYLNHPSANVRGNACLVLAEIGTQQSVRPLMSAVSKSKDRLTINAARQALQTVQFRMKNSKVEKQLP